VVARFERRSAVWTEEGKDLANDCAADDFEHFYDACVVRALEIPERSAVEGGAGELGDCVLRVLLSGAGKPHRVVCIQHGATEDDSGSDHADGVCGFLGAVSGGEVQVELRSGIRVHGVGGVFCVPQVVGKEVEGRKLKVEGKSQAHTAVMAASMAFSPTYGAERAGEAQKPLAEWR